LDKLYKLLDEEVFASDTYADVDGNPEQPKIPQQTLSSDRIAKALEAQSGLPSAKFKANDTPVDGSRYIRSPRTTI
jgi:hypothetical protein